MSTEELNKNESNIVKISDVIPTPEVKPQVVEGVAAEKVVEKPVVEVAATVEKPAEKPKVSFKDRFKRIGAKMSSFKAFAKDKATKVFKKGAAEQLPSTRRFKPSARTMGLMVIGAFVILITVSVFMPTSANETPKTAHWATTTAIGTAIYHEKLDCPYLKAATGAGFSMVEARNAPDASGRIRFTVEGVSYSAAPCTCVAK